MRVVRLDKRLHQVYLPSRSLEDRYRDSGGLPVCTATCGDRWFPVHTYLGGGSAGTYSLSLHEHGPSACRDNRFGSHTTRVGRFYLPTKRIRSFCAERSRLQAELDNPTSTLSKRPATTATMLIPKADRKKIHEYLFREGVLVAKKDFNLPKHPDIDTKNLFVVKALQSLNSRGYVKTQFSWQYYYYTLTPEGLDYLREWLHLPAEIVPATHIKQQRSHAPPRGMLGEGERERRPFGGRGRGGDRGDREGGYRRRDAGEGGKEGGAPGGFEPQFRGGFGRGRGAAPPS
ncbi:40S ribosomal protein S10-A [Colletotrichum tanaceti]|nr:40S ribosomal protein S10-A [Colletotrichum tanaceti]